jgi:hypothetical protein
MGQEKIIVREMVVSFSSATKSVILPAGSRITNIGVIVTENFDDTGTDLLNIGIAGTANFYVSALDIAAAGVKSVTLLKGGLLVSATLPQTITAVYTGQNGNATTGSATITITAVQV